MKKHLILILVTFAFSCNFKSQNIPRIIKAQKNISICDTLDYDVFNFFNEDKITRFQKEIDRFKIQDSLNPPKENSILFVGSSSIRKWKTLESDFHSIPVINRGFGGSTFPELIYYSEELIFKYKPRTVLIYEGDNDQYFLNPSDILKNACYLEKIIHKRLPKTKVFFISVKPSPARRNKNNGMILTNSFLKNYAEHNKKTYYIDVWNPMFNKNGKINGDIFSHDSLHLNNEGYKIWTKIIKTAIMDNN
ncbi:MAG: GDSL-type esterase/lipase family protein [Bacteroidota bacterium]|nr:GDSL-type esterase/lipase family protein [Bacteroidota bacterium]